jgi:transcriptional regulator with XRE-family HTH domain
MDLREVFAVNLRRLRNAKGVSQDDLAHEANVSRSYLSQALGVEPAELLRMPSKRRSGMGQ